MAAESQQIGAALAEGTAEEREAAYATIEGAVRGGGSEAVSLAVACAKLLVESVLCAPATKVGEAEAVRASLLLYEAAKVDMIAVSAELSRKNDQGKVLINTTWTAPDTVLAAMLAKAPGEWHREDAVLASANLAVHAASWAVGYTAVLKEAEVAELEWADDHLSTIPYKNPPEIDHYTPLATACLDLVRTAEADEQIEGIVVGAGVALCWMAQTRAPVGRALYEAGFLEVFQANVMQKFNPMELISRDFLVPTAVLGGFKDVVEDAQAAGIEVINDLIGAGALDMAISCLTAYQVCASPL